MRKNRRLLLVSTMVVILVAALPLIVFAASGAWNEAKVGPVLYSNGVWYCMDFNPTGQYVPADARIVMIAWQWDVFPDNPYVIAKIQEKNNPSRYFDASPKIGHTTALNGDLANQTFQFCFKKFGGPVTYGKGYDSITVSWQTP